MLKSLLPIKSNHYPEQDKKLRIFNCISVFVALTVISYGCAKVGAPMGGPVDETPPKVIKSEPVNQSVYFSGNEIEILFDEYIKLSNLYNELLVSPPLENRPEIRVRNKSLLIGLNDDLLPGTTYTMNFGNSIIDNNADNPLTGFEFVFSTGSYIDSLALIGEAFNAADNEPPQKDERVYIMLYEHLDDSVPLLEKPRYLGKVDEIGHFSVKYMHPDTFRAIVLKDTDGDLLYDPVTDAIAFADSFVVISPATVEEVHLIEIKDTINRADTVDAGAILQAIKLNLRYFYEESSKVFLNNKDRVSRNEILLTFTRSPYDSVSIKPLNFAPGSKWYVSEHSADMDTIRYWITDTTIAAMDRIDMEVSYTTTGIADQFIRQHDTVQFYFKQLEESLRSGGRQTDPVAQKETSDLILISNITNNQNVNLNAAIRYTTDTPLDEINPGLIDFKRIVDSVEYSQKFSVIRDSASLTRFNIETEWTEESLYRLMLLPGAVSDIYGLTNDSITLLFRTRPEDYYSNIKITVQGDMFPVVIQVIDRRQQVIRQQYLERPGLVFFDFIIPAAYSLKAIHDRNGNRKWDTGDYLNQIQPEKVFYNSEELETRSNWDHEVLWQIED